LCQPRDGRINYAIYLHYFFPHQVIENFQNGKDRNGILFLGDMVTILVTASEVLYDFCE